MIVPFARLPRRNYDEKKENRPRIDIDRFDDDSDSDNEKEEVMSKSTAIKNTVNIIESLSVIDSDIDSDNDEEDNDDASSSSSGSNASFISKYSMGRKGSRYNKGVKGSYNADTAYQGQPSDVVSDIDNMDDEKSHISYEANSYKTHSTNHSKTITNTKQTLIKSYHIIKKNCIIVYKVTKAFIRRRKWYIKFNQWRERKREERRHPILRYYEEQVSKLEEKIKNEIQKELNEMEKEVKIAAIKLEKYNKMRIENEYRNKLINIKFETERKQRKREYKRMEFLSFHMQIWSNENHKKHLAEQEEKERIAEEKRIQLKKQNEVIAYETKKKLDKLAVLDDYTLTQETLQMERMSSALSGVISPKRHKIIPIVPKENSKKIQLSLRDDINFSWRLRVGRNLMDNPFQIDIRLYSEVEILECINIGEKGLLYLCAEFIRGSVSNLCELNLSRCQIKARGVGRLLHALRLGRILNLHTLNLRNNAITARAMEYFKASFDNGSLQNLRILNLRDNELKDEGAHIIAHMMIHGCFTQLTELLLQNNFIGEKGIIKITNVMKAVGMSKCKNLHRLCLQENLCSAEIKNDLLPHPYGLSL